MMTSGFSRSARNAVAFIERRRQITAGLALALAVEFMSPLRQMVLLTHTVY
jgi:hypothetical protein